MDKKKLLIACIFIMVAVNGYAIFMETSKNYSIETPFEIGDEPVSYVDIDMHNSHKVVLKVDGRPYFMTNIQVRLDKLRYNWGWGVSAREAIIKQAAEDGFNTVSIPIHWREVEPSKDKFDWSILDEYMNLCKKYDLKMELLWFSWSSGGRIQYLTSSLLRTPDYVCTKSGISEFTVLRTTDPWTLDWHDTRLRERETYIVSRIMEHIAEWDTKNNNPHTVIGVQLGNEPLGYEQEVKAAHIIDYYHHVGSAVKNSKYVVWTRLNCVNGQCNERINANEELRIQEGSNIDFVGIDVYGTNPSNISRIMPYTGKNYRMIMESGAEVTKAAIYQMAALYGNTAYIHYDMCGPDGHGLYDKDGNSGFKQHGPYVEDLRVLNKLMKSNMTDLAINAQGYGLYVYNCEGSSIKSSIGLEGIAFTPKVTSSQAIAIHRSNTEVILINTKGGTFTIPESMEVLAAGQGYFDNNNQWVDEGSIEFTGTSIIPPVATTVRLICSDPGKRTFDIALQSEFAEYGNGSMLSIAYSGAGDSGFAGHGYVRTAANGYIKWLDVDGFADGKVLLGFRYAASKETDVNLIINEDIKTVTLPSSGGWDTFEVFVIPALLKPGTNNTICLEATGTKIYVDELHLYKDDGTAIEENLVQTSKKALVYTDLEENELFLNTNGEQRENVCLYDMAGQLIIQQKASLNKIDITGLRKGCYLVKIGSKSAVFMKKR